MAKTTNKPQTEIAKDAILPQTETTLPNDQKQSEMNDQTQTTEIAQDAKTDVKTIESLTQEIKSAKLKLREIEDLHDLDDTHPDVIAQTKIVDDLDEQKKSLIKEIAKEKQREEYQTRLIGAKQHFTEITGLTDEKLNELIESYKNDLQDKDKKTNIMTSFSTIFGNPPKYIAENTTGKDIAKSSNNGTSGVNLSKLIKDAIANGQTQDEIVKLIEDNSDLRDAKSKKRYTDTKWQYEQDLKKGK